MATFLHLRFAAQFLGFALLIAAAAPASAAPFGYTVSEGELRRFDLANGTYETIGATGVTAGIPSLTATSAGTFHGLGPSLDTSGVLVSLYSFDRATGHGEQVGPTGSLNGHRRLASAGDGQLFSSDGAGNLYQVDTATASTTAIAATGAEIIGLAAYQGGLYLLDYQGAGNGCLLRRFALGDHSLSTLGQLTCVESDIAFGEEGDLYQVNLTGFVGIPEPLPDWWIEVYRYDLATGRQDWAGDWSSTPGRTQVAGLAAVGGGPTLDVPIGGSGLLLLAAGLAVAALRMLRA